ncbi:MAG: hypothetical protein A2Y33_13375 [Spirochaetes bacterium GWF1_51_8]|nr:MAG: hypothetical protein A2Y33_13375 [Spirochaetes bacterium GWF1_51_8]
MKIVILNGNSDAGNKEFEKYLAEFSAGLVKNGHEPEILTLRDMNIRYCTGCWGCWVKTPGACVLKDDSMTVCDKVINSGMFILASPLSMGYPSSLLKKTMDKLIPLVHPYAMVYKKEMHHKKRYQKDYPSIAILFQKENDTDEDDIRILRVLFDRLGINFHSDVKRLFLTETSPMEAADEINRI